MLDSVRKALSRLRDSFSRQAEEAYKERDAKRRTGEESAYSEGEGHAFGTAADEVRRVQDEDKSKGPQASA